MTPSPVFNFDERYFQDSDYTQKELYKLQEKTIELMKTSTDIKKDLKEQTRFNDKEIDICLSEFNKRGLLQRIRIRVDGDVPIYKYFF